MEVKGVKRIEIVSEPGWNARSSNDTQERARHPDHQIVVEFETGRKVVLHPTYADFVAMMRAST